MKENLMLNNNSCIKILFIFIFGSAIFSNISIGQIEKGPYLQNTTQTGITICWISEEIGLGEVKYGLDSSLGVRKSDNRKTTYHQITLNGLNPQTEYFYQVTDGGYESEVYKFWTAPVDTTAFSFVVLGDTRDGHEVHNNLVNRIILHQPNFVVHTGDFVMKGNIQSDWDKFFEINNQLMKFIPYYPVLGNHEDNDERYYNYFALPDKENYYSFTWGNSNFIVLDSNHPFNGREDQKEYLSDVLANSTDKKFTFIFYHHPPYSSVDKRKQSREEFRNQFIDVFKPFSPDIIFNGHDHNYQRYLVDSINYVVAGGGGAPLYEIDNPDSGYVFGKKEFSYCFISVAGNLLKMEVYDLTGKMIDSFYTIK
ncbi:MAG: metallophosphoesterase family protein [Bacteroidota bacterium]|nr:metallophosphoesterase family protein [Bacteroidota bacterium]